MALRDILSTKHAVLHKKCKYVKEITPRVKMLIEDMKETMEDANGVGLAAPQIGVLKRIVVINIGDGWHVLINPEIVSKSGTQLVSEACLSVPNRMGLVERPMNVTVNALNENGEEITLEASGFLAQAACHEIDHLDGIVYTDIMKEEIFDEDVELGEQID